MDDADRLQVVLQYHERTKHHFDRYARGPGQLDWRNQPNPFRRWAGAPLLRLPLLEAGEGPRYADLFRAGAVASMPLDIRSLSRLLEHALALSAWKQAGGTRWALRCNPSSGNLHPTEAYVLLDALEGLGDTPGLYHYAPREHALERRADCSSELFKALTRELAAGSFLVGLSSVHWREAWKYGERAFRYCQHDAGHAIGALRIAAAMLGWSAVVLDDVDDETIDELLGLNREADFIGAEREAAELVMAVWPADAGLASGAGGQRSLPLHLDASLARGLAGQCWHGTANRLSRDDPVRWEVIDEVTYASRKPAATQRCWYALGDRQPPNREAAAQGPDAARIIRQRRSLLACDGHTSITAASFYAMLARLMPRVDLPVGSRPMPWDAIPWEPAVHLGLFVHRVEGLAPGLYVLARDPSRLDALKASMQRDFDWLSPPGCPGDLPLRLLQRGDARELAMQVSCWQDIAGDGAFSLGMLAEYRQALLARGPWFYRRLFWECGLIGQVLYLEAEAAGVRSTGIGCFFDDAVHQVFGLGDLAFQSLYHFTVGGPVEDVRLMTLAAYGGGGAGGD